MRPWAAAANLPLSTTKRPRYALLDWRLWLKPKQAASRGRCRSMSSERKFLLRVARTTSLLRSNPLRRPMQSRRSTCTAKSSQKRGSAKPSVEPSGWSVQPGVEFGNRNVVYYDPGKATDLRGVLDREPQFVFEAHSTDYQGSSRLAALVRDGFSILKVGPELTFVLREALYALDLIASDLVLGYGQRPLFKAMEELMLAQPEHWSRHYGGTEDEKRVLRQYSLSDRIRYYWTNSAAQAAVKHLVESLRRRSVPMTLFWQYLPGAEQFADTPLEPEDVLLWRVTRSLDAYHRACNASA